MPATARPALDLVLRNGDLIDGTRAPRRRADVGVRDGRVVEIGRCEGAAAREIDATGRVVAPGFIDIHTHYDAQLCWDGLATPSPLHGVTTVLTGNCSLSLAPVRGEGPRRVVGMFERIEDIGAPTFEAAVPFCWESFGEWLEFLRPRLSVNLAPLVGHSTLRLYAMGAASQQRAATDAEIETMCALLREAVQAGARGLSLSHLDMDEDLRPVPSRFAGLREKLALARAVVEAGGRVLESVTPAGTPDDLRAFIAELGTLARETGIVSTLQPVLEVPGQPGYWKWLLDLIAQENAKGGVLFGQSTPRTFDTNLRLEEQFFTFFLLPAWADIMRRPPRERGPLLADPARRPKLIEEGLPYLSMFLDCASVGETFAPENAALRGRKLPDIAKERGCTTVDALIDIALLDDLRTEFRIVAMMQSQPDVTAQILAHPNVLVGASDGGAHVSQFCGAGDTTELLATYVRQRGDFSLEDAVWRLTGQPAEVFGLRDVGRIAVGRGADLVVFDPATVAPGAESYVRDVPGNTRRYLRDAVGIDAVFVAGEPIVEAGRYRDARRGRLA
jgi:N-acyl-D-aspartate/D-glutamate deacylase